VIIGEQQVGLLPFFLTIQLTPRPIKNSISLAPRAAVLARARGLSRSRWQRAELVYVKGYLYRPGLL
jgi:hypothetical protein